MKIRVLTSIGLAVVGLPILLLSEYLVYPMVLGLLGIIAIYEASAVTGMRKNLAVLIPSYLVVFAMPMVSYFFRNDQTEYLLICLFILVIFMMYLFAYAVLLRGKVAFADISSHLTMLFYISFSFTALSLVRYIENGAYIFALVFVASWICDTFAYFVGRAIGKHKLIEEVSPKKTVEGSIGGIVFATLAFMLYGFIVSMIDESPSPRYIVLLVLGFVLSIVAQFGDLICSLIKREHGIKDYGAIFPGHGGVLDRFDSIIAVAPLLYIICLIFPPFV